MTLGEHFNRRTLSWRVPTASAWLERRSEGKNLCSATGDRWSLPDRWYGRTWKEEPMTASASFCWVDEIGGLDKIRKKAKL
jgi:hypothetical protein